MKHLLKFFSFAFFFTWLTTSAWADSYPSKPIRLVVPFVAGGSADLLARIVGQRLAEKVGQPVVVENRAGASGHIGAEAVARSRPDGYTLLLGTSGVHAAYSIFPNLRYDPSTALTPISIIGEFPNVLVVNTAVTAKSVNDVISLARARPGGLFFGSAGNGSSTHLAAELFKSITKVDIRHIAYKGSGAALTDLIGNQTQLMFENLPTVLPFIQSGQLRPIALTSKQRFDSLPGVPTVAESGVPDYQFGAWFTIAVPAGTPPEVAAKLNRDIDAVVNDRGLAAKWKELGVRPVGGSLSDVAAFVASERSKWSGLVASAHLNAE